MSRSLQVLGVVLLAGAGGLLWHMRRAPATAPQPATQAALSGRTPAAHTASKSPLDATHRPPQQARPQATIRPENSRTKLSPNEEDTASPEHAAHAVAGALQAGRSVWPLTKEGIDGGIKEVVGDILGCYQAALEEYPDLDGGFTVHFTVDDSDGTGKVVELEITDSDNEAIPALVDAPMEDCVMDHIGSLEFDAPTDGPSTVAYPFLFSPG